MGLVVQRFDVFLVNLDPTVGREIQKARPCVVISPDEMNRYIDTVIIAPMTTEGKAYPTRVICQFQGKDGQIVLDQIRTIDKRRLVKKLGQISQDEQKEVLDTLAEMFAE
ncbi:type II toxin-antitoxin system PemK/MazF family toxin [Trichothermofontia sichuanensis B231]|uniref:type II toxin-antitoxin system PemK/MazF family toxin n=1 Tax=Trichothermofontia sichuanensis TaxID=3045816 RepID=UPI00224823A4|nr:type II toxin-antitoxin system PemK/MazF family toxin [Trichothermofontia sichuanensis]UZQ53519.1 type II toxin-antitoxin system PemK/MazF family toxin [Trichothermofontia sichuanensis B231]